MGKKNKNNKNKNVEHDDVEMMDDVEEFDSPVQYPSKFERDYIAVMDDETLHNITRSLVDSIGKVNRLNLNPYPWEVELCYLQQEVQVRSARRAAHVTWLSSQPVAEVE